MSVLVEDDDAQGDRCSCTRMLTAPHVAGEPALLHWCSDQCTPKKLARHGPFQLHQVGHDVCLSHQRRKLLFAAMDAREEEQMVETGTGARTAP